MSRNNSADWGRLRIVGGDSDGVPRLGQHEQPAGQRPAPFSRSASVINAAESPPPGCLAVYHQPDGLTIEQAAHVLDIATSTAQNDWAYARNWLRLEIEKSRQDAPS
jgi:ECF sigma factor